MSSPFSMAMLFMSNLLIFIIIFVFLTTFVLRYLLVTICTIIVVILHEGSPYILKVVCRFGLSILP